MLKYFGLHVYYTRSEEGKITTTGTSYDSNSDENGDMSNFEGFKNEKLEDITVVPDSKPDRSGIDVSSFGSSDISDFGANQDKKLNVGDTTRPNIHENPTHTTTFNDKTNTHF